MSDLKPVIDLSRNPNQGAYFDAVMMACTGASAHRYFAYGGAIRGGKTFVTLFILIVLARRYPGSRWHVIREDYPALLTTTIPSFEKLKPAGVRMNNQPGNCYALFPNGSRIYFKPESLTQDPNLDSFLGLETNGIFLEQSEELSERMWSRAKERTGSWYIDPMPPGLVFLTFNPTDTWSREVFYEPWRSDALPDRYYYRNALPSDNPFVTADQWATWSELDEVTRRMMIEGDWDARRNDNAFYFAFSRTQHVRQDLEFNSDLGVVHLSFDQNVLPYLSLSCWQLHTNGDYQTLFCFDEIALAPPKSTTEDVCTEFMGRYSSQVRQAFLYGDASGNRRDTRSRVTDYDIAKRVLRPILNNVSDRTFAQNPDVLKRREFVNAILAGRVPGARLAFHPRCKKTIADLHEVSTDANGHKHKKKSRGPGGESFEVHGHLSDTADYVICKVFAKQYADFVGNKFKIRSTV